MTRIDESTSKALRALDKAFRKARAAHIALSSEFEEAEAAWVKQPKDVPGWDHAGSVKKAQAEARYAAAKDGLQTKVERIWMEYQREVAKIREDLVGEVREADTLVACDLDPAAVSLLNAGVMTARDYRKMAEQYSENAAVLALIRRKAKEYSDSLRGGINDEDNAAERLAALSVAENAKTGSELAVQSFDGWVAAARTIAGQDSNGSFRSLDRIRHPSGLAGWEDVLKSTGVSFSDDAVE